MNGDERLVGRTRRESGYGTMSGVRRDGQPTFQDDSGARFDTWAVGDPDGKPSMSIDVPREDRSAVQFDRVEGDAAAFGERELQDGEFEAVVPGGGGGGGGVDRDGDGIPDGAQIMRTTKHFAGGREINEKVSFRKGEGGEQGNSLASFSVLGNPYKNTPSIGEDKHNSNLDRLTMNKARGSRDTGQLAAADKVEFNRAGGIAGARAHAERVAIGPALAAAKGRVQAERFKFTATQTENMAKHGVRRIKTEDGGEMIFHNGQMYRVKPKPGDPKAVALHGDPTAENPEGPIVGHIGPDGVPQYFKTGDTGGGDTGGGDDAAAEDPFADLFNKDEEAG